MLALKPEAIEEAMLTITMRHSSAVTFYSTHQNSTNISPQYHLHTILDTVNLDPTSSCRIESHQPLQSSRTERDRQADLHTEKLHQYTYMGSQPNPNHSRCRRRTSP